MIGMTGFFRFHGTRGKERGLLALFILHTLGKRPGTGYDLLKEIEEKTGGKWVPSKGTLYPVLKQLEEEGLIELTATGARAKNIYTVTPRGKRTLVHIRRHRREHGEKLALYRDLVTEVFGGEKMALTGLGMEIHALLQALPPEKEEEAIQVMEECRTRLKNL